MAKRFTSTEIWDEDWFLEMPTEYKLFWFYMLATCDHAGCFKVNLRSFCGLNEVKVSSTTALEHFNKGKDRIRVVNQSVWYIEDFFAFQYGSTFNPNNRLHDSIEKTLKKYNIELTSIRGLKDLKDRVKDKDIYIEDSNSTEELKNSVLPLTNSKRGGDKKTNKYPNEESHDLELPESYIKKSIEYLDINKQIKKSKGQILVMWDMFKLKNLNGSKFYDTNAEIFSHFLNTLQNEKANGLQQVVNQQPKIKL